MNENHQNTVEESRMARFVAWRKRHLAETPFMFIVVTVVGLFTGGCAFLLKRMIAALSHWLTSPLAASHSNLLLLLLPLAGLMITGFLTRKVLRAKLSHGVRRLRMQLKGKDYYIPPTGMVYPMLASTITLGFGGSAGSEGPIACTGAAIGGNLARWLGMSPRMVMLMIGCGAGAGIAGIFKAPLGGALFTLEVMRIPMTTVPVLALLVCTVTAGMTAYALGGFTNDLWLADSGMMFDSSLLWFVVGLGIVCGVYSLYYSYIMKQVERLLTVIRKNWLRNLIAGSMLSLAIFMLPSLYGEGYGVIGSIINGDLEATVADGIFAGTVPGSGLMIAVVAATVAVKCFATSATNSGGGVSGDFAPTLFAGSMLGLLFVLTVKWVWNFELPLSMFVLAGMAGVMAGSIRAPLMALVLTVEMVGAYGCFFPLLVVVAISFGIVRLFTYDDFYSRRADRPNGLLSRILGIRR